VKLGTFIPKNGAVVWIPEKGGEKSMWETSNWFGLEPVYLRDTSYLRGRRRLMLSYLSEGKM
jgi:hypothetical protein